MVTAQLTQMPHIPSRASSLPKVQQLFRLSRSIFRQNRTPTERQINEALQLMRKIPLSELGFDEKTVNSGHYGQKTLGFFSRGKESKSIRYLSVYEGSDFDIGIFCLPPGAIIPLHDHPGMTVMSQLLYGKMHIRSFDLLRKGGGRTWSAKLRVESVMDDNNCSTYLLPDRANVHMFRALTPCAMLDVLAPPYSAEDDRLCTYYRFKQPKLDLENNDGFLKQEIVQEMSVIDIEACLPPPGFNVVRGCYRGIQPDVNEDGG